MLLTNFMWCRTEANLESLRAHANNHIDRQIKTKEKQKITKRTQQTSTDYSHRIATNSVVYGQIIMKHITQNSSTKLQKKISFYSFENFIHTHGWYAHNDDWAKSVVCRPSLKTQQIFWQLFFFAAFVFYALFSSFVHLLWVFFSFRAECWNTILLFV